MKPLKEHANISMTTTTAIARQLLHELRQHLQKLFRLSSLHSQKLFLECSVCVVGIWHLGSLLQHSSLVGHVRSAKLQLPWR